MRVRSTRHPQLPANCNESLYVPARQIPIECVLAHVTTREHNDLIRAQQLVDEGVRKPVQERLPHVAVVAHRHVHLRVEFEEGECGVEFSDEHAAESRYLCFIPTTASRISARAWGRNETRGMPSRASPIVLAVRLLPDH